MRSLIGWVFVALLATLPFAGCSKADDPEPDQAVANPDLTPPKPDQKVVKPDQKVVTPDQTPATPDTRPYFDGTVAKCAFEVNLATAKLPCMCVNTLVYDVKIQYPDCVAPKIVKCCPAEGKPKCE